MRPTGTPRTAPSELRLGIVYAVTAYVIYGGMPIYMRLLERVPPTEIMAHRALWSFVFLAIIASITRRWGPIGAALASRRTLLTLIVTAALIGANWLMYIWAVLNRHILETSLAFFITPLTTVLLGVVVLRERLRPAQWAAVAIASVGVAALATGHGMALWITLFLVFTFSSYGLIRKIAPIDPLTGLLVETAVLTPVALGWLIWLATTGALALGANPIDDVLLVSTGIITAVPLLLFTAAAQRMPYSMFGPFQYIGPTLQALQAVLLFGEPFTGLHMFTFGCIWTAIAIFIVDGIRSSRQTETAAAIVPQVPTAG